MKVIVAIDQTEFANQIIDEVAATEWPLDTQIKILTVVGSLSSEAEAAAETAKQLEKRKKFANDLVMKARQQISESCPQSMVYAEVRCGEPHLEIIYSAAEWMPDRILIGAHGNSPNRFFGKIAQSIPQNSTCSVQIVRLKKSKNAATETVAEAANVSK